MYNFEWALLFERKKWTIPNERGEHSSWTKHKWNEKIKWWISHATVFGLSRINLSESEYRDFVLLLLEAREKDCLPSWIICTWNSFLEFFFILVSIQRSDMIGFSLWFNGSSLLLLAMEKNRTTNEIKTNAKSRVFCSTNDDSRRLNLFCSFCSTLLLQQQHVLFFFCGKKCVYSKWILFTLTVVLAKYSFDVPSFAKSSRTERTTLFRFGIYYKFVKVWFI